MTMALSKRLSAEFLGTLWLVLGGCGSAVLAASIPNVGIGYAGVALAFGLTVLTGVYALGHISGGHFNPAVTAGLWAAKRIPGRDVLPYWIAQVLGAIASAGILFLIASNKPGFAIGGFAANGFGEHSPQKYEIIAAFAGEVVMTFFFLVVILGTTHRNSPSGFAGLAIGLSLTLIHLVMIPVTNTSVNPARSTGPALILAIYSDPWALKQLWLFWLAPLLGGLLAGYFFPWLGSEPSGDVVIEERVVVQEIVETGGKKK